MKYFLYDGTWSILHVPYKGGPEPESAIDKATTLNIPVNATHYEKAGTWTAAWVSTGDAKKVCVCADDVTAALLNANFDTQQKLWYGKVVKVTHLLNIAILSCEDIMVKLLREPIPAADNVGTFDGYDEFKIKSFPTANDEIELEDADGGAVTFNNDEHNNRAVRVIARDTDPKALGYCTADANITIQSGTTPGTFAKAYAKLYDNLVATGYGWGIQAESGSVPGGSAPWFYVQVLFHVPRCPVNHDGELSVQLYGQHRSLGYTTVSTAITIQAWNYVTGAWVTIWNLTNDWPNSTPLDTDDEKRITMKKDEFLEYYDWNNEQMKFRFHSGDTSNGAVASESCFDATELKLEVRCYEQHEPAEFRILDTKDNDTLELAVSVSITDTVTSRLNVGDAVQILYNDEEWLEDYATISLTHDIWDICAPTSTKPTFYDLNYKPFSQIVDDICDRNSWYWYESRTTSMSEPWLYFSERDAPVFVSLSADPSDYDWESTQVEINSMDRLRQVVLKNENTCAIYPSYAALDDLQVKVMNRNDVPDAYLDEVAQAIYNQRDEAFPAVRVSLRTVQVQDNRCEGFESYAVDAVPSSTYWTVYNTSADAYFKTSAGKYGHIYDNDVAKQLLPFYKVATTHGAADDWWQCKVYVHYLGTNARLYILTAAAGLAKSYGYVLFNQANGNMYVLDTDFRLLQAFSYDTWYWIRYVVIDATHFDVWISTNGTSWTEYTNSGSHYNAQNNIYTNKIGAMAFYDAQGASYTMDAYIDDITVSWVTVAPDDHYTEYNVQDAPDDLMFAGSWIHLHACPTSITATDYKIDDDFVIRSLKWKNDDTAELELGFADATVQSVDEKVDAILTRHANG